MTFLYFLEEMERERVLQGVLRRCSLGRKTAFLNPKIYLKIPNSANFLPLLFSFYFGKWKGVLRLNNLRRITHLKIIFFPNTAYSCNSLQFLPIPFPALIDP
jgi:hypothetical protein